jgi:Carbonic anhydrase
MSTKWVVPFALTVLCGVLLAGLRWTSVGQKSQFLIGGALVGAGYQLQDGLESYDFAHTHEITPDQVWSELRKQNGFATGIRHGLPRTPRHALVAVVVCMDARIDTNELVGDTRHYYYVIRTAGSVMSAREEEMLELAVANGVKLVLLTTHSDCAAERVASRPELRAKYPALAKAVDEREARITEFLARPVVAAAVSAGTLVVKRVNIDTLHDQFAAP